MGFWPFGGGKRQRAGESGDNGRDTLLRRTPSDLTRSQEKKADPETKVGGLDSKAQQQEYKAHRLSQTRLSKPSRAQTTPVQSIIDARRISRTESPYDEKAMYQQTPLSQTSLGPETFTVVQGPPTLHGKRVENDPHPTRRKSSKRKAEDFAREREIRAMTSSPIPIPKRPATLYGDSPLQRDSRRIPGALNRRLERPTSEVSLPIQGSLPDISDFASQNSFKIGILAALSPRPTIRYDANSRNAAGKLPARQGMAIRQAIADDDVSDKKRIDELADDLDAGGLRELMERDRRRRERKKEAEKAKLQRRLQRRAERQREEEAARRARTEAYVRSSPLGTPGHQSTSIESSPNQPVTTEQKRMHRQAESDPFQDVAGPSTVRTIRNPFEDEADMDIMQDRSDSDNEFEGNEAPPVPIRSPQRRIQQNEYEPRQKPSQSTLSPPVSPVNKAIDRSSLSQASFVNREPTPDIPESSSLERRASDQSSLRLSSWTTFFRRGTRRKFAGPAQGRTTPSEFSNTSRESFSRKQPPPPPPVAANRTFRRSDSATPQRTLSRFREDLPELPISPPDSRIQSPEAPGALSRNARLTNADIDASSVPYISSARDSIAQQSAEQSDRRERKRSTEYDLPVPTTDLIVSQSLASVDSEASWLSGKPSKRLSGQRVYGLKPSQSSLPRPMPGAFDQDFDTPPEPASDVYPAQTSAKEDVSVGVTDTREQGGDQESKTLDSLLGESTAKEKEAEVLYASSAEPARKKSQEDLSQKAGTCEGRKDSAVDPDDEDDDDDDDDSATSEVESPQPQPLETSILRARSVEYKGGHLRHISAGSAKLLDIRRSSIHSDNSRPTSAAAVRRSDPIIQSESPSKSAEL